jgi:surface polysaccharide O-acyltransferase-like enzyme
MLGVILVHTVANYVSSYGKIPLASWDFANLIDSFSRSCVPVFVMISGALLLGKTDNIKEFTLKRTQRILYPFLFWSLIYAFRKASHHFEFKSDALDIVHRTFSLIFQGASYHFWYIFMIIGLYLFIPILNAWVKNATKKELHYFLIIWGITLLYNDYSKTYLPPFDLIYFTKYIGYLVLGYYLDKHCHITKSNLYLSIFLVVGGTLLTYGLTAHFSKAENEFVPTFYSYTSINVALTAAGVFILFKQIANNSNYFLKLLDQTSFGIFFIHVIILEKIRGFIFIQHYTATPTKALLYILIVGVSCYALSFVTIYLLSQLKPLRKWIG